MQKEYSGPYLKLGILNLNANYLDQKNAKQATYKKHKIKRNQLFIMYNTDAI